MKQIIHSKVIGEQFESFSELFEICSNRPLHPLYGSSRYSETEIFSTGLKDDRYPRHADFDTTHEQVKWGCSWYDEEYKKAVDEMYPVISGFLKSHQRKSSIKKSIVGQSVLVARALRGHPKSFNYREVEQKKQKVVSLLFQLSTPWFTDAKERMKCGVMLMAIIYVLEQSGHQVELLLSPTAVGTKPRDGGSKRISTVEVAVKQARSRMNIRKLQFPLSSQSTLFHIGKWWYHRFPRCDENLGSGEGINAFDEEGSLCKDYYQYAREQRKVLCGIRPWIRDFNLDPYKIYEDIQKQIAML